jgi:hypothetical protein
MPLPSLSHIPGGSFGPPNIKPRTPKVRPPKPAMEPRPAKAPKPGRPTKPPKVAPGFRNPKRPKPVGGVGVQPPRVHRPHG